MCHYGFITKNGPTNRKDATMATITAQDTYDHFVGSGALAYPWWTEGESHGCGESSAPEDWFVELTLDEFGTKRIDHKALKSTINKLARTAKDNRPEFMNPAVLRECSRMLKDPADVDFDSDMADQVLQFIFAKHVVFS